MGSTLTGTVARIEHFGAQTRSDLFFQQGPWLDKKPHF
jgi:hypothetical protein